MIWQEIERGIAFSCSGPEDAVVGRCVQRLKKLAKLLIRQSGIPDDIAHRDRIHGIVSRHSEHARTIGHNDVFALPGDPKSSLFESPYSVKVIHPCQFGHG